MKKLLLLLGFLAGTAQAADEYYTLSAVVTQNLGGAPGNLPLTVTGWIETSGFGKACYTGFDGPGPCLPVVNGHPTDNPIIIAEQINLTYNGFTETTSGWLGYMGIVATPKGLFCNKCAGWNAEDDAGYALTNTGVQYLYYDTGAGGTTPGQLQFQTPYLKNNYRIGNAPTTTMPTTAAMAAPEMDPGQAGAALMLLVGTALVLKGRRRG
jgi:hypothetical protein